MAEPQVRGLLVCGALSHPESRWPCSKEPGHYYGHENACSHWPRRDTDTCEPSRFVAPANPADA